MRSPWRPARGVLNVNLSVSMAAVRGMKRRCEVVAADLPLSLADGKRLWNVDSENRRLRVTRRGRRRGRPARSNYHGRTLAREQTPSSLICAAGLYLTKLLIVTSDSVGRHITLAPASLISSAL